ncbi:excisionase family DNA-binding protein [Amycolatopsis plumensis]
MSVLRHDRSTDGVLRTAGDRQRADRDQAGPATRRNQATPRGAAQERARNPTAKLHFNPVGTTKMTESLPRRAWTPKEVAAQLGIPYETVLDLIHKKKLGAVTAGRYYLIPDFEIENFLRTQKLP